MKKPIHRQSDDTPSLIKKLRKDIHGFLKEPDQENNHVVFFPAIKVERTPGGFKKMLLQIEKLN